jgi:hypothetical protein
MALFGKLLFKCEECPWSRIKGWSVKINERTRWKEKGGSYYFCRADLMCKDN